MTAVLAPGRLRSLVHNPDRLRSCVHLLEVPPERLLLGWAGVAALNFQPRVCRGALPCIASRQGDILTLAFDAFGPGPDDNRSHRATPLTLRWRYQLEAVDDPRVVLAVQLPSTLKAVADV